MPFHLLFEQIQYSDNAALVSLKIANFGNDSHLGWSSDLLDTT